MRRLLVSMMLASATVCMSQTLPLVIPADTISHDPEEYDLGIVIDLTPEILDDMVADLTGTSLLGDKIKRLTDDDYKKVADELGIEVAAMKAVVDIEAGSGHRGFAAPGQPLINFDLTMFRQFASKRGINLTKYRKSHPVVFSRPDARRYGSQQAAQHARLKSARTIDNRTAIEGTFWGMFQIGGFNWAKCGASSIDDFVKRMSDSEHEQLEMFARFLVSCDLVKHLKSHNWAAFARGYNGPSYASRGYHTKLARAYAKYKKSEK
ncbi:MAG: N-acetylmuramidase family protein [Pseudoflavonifractor sp.]|nr:N-acetylmuramidase family protein [Pseudoflavonifractor sp.]